jgi:hypothetical protein
MTSSKSLKALAETEGLAPETAALLQILALSAEDVEAGRTVPACQAFERVWERAKAKP